MDRTTGSQSLGSFVQSMTERMTTLARTLGAWVLSEPRTLQAQEEQVVRQLHELRRREEDALALRHRRAVRPREVLAGVPVWRPSQLPPHASR